ncbi:unnamed protein product [Coffea canephora]|uniref:DH200=94 genomic scaffold, scaffold_2080 n=1 Tax=Coffea canephora TaxID=49390 RepID=A0A068VJC6_COFCA|nr:unnamed protein product [Coffea canephora]
MKEFYCFILLFMLSLCDASNKTPIKSIKSPDGDIIDCIHIYDQPAFDHPLLKNHTILMRPSFHPNSELLNPHSQENTNSITQSWQLSGKCPDNTIPILRNQNARKTKKYVMKQNETVSQSSSDDDMKSLDPYTHELELITNDLGSHKYAIAYVQGDKYHGAKATINVWQPYVQNRIEFSLSQIWVVGGHDSTINTVEAGWTVDPSVFGDNKPRLFTYWTRDHYGSTGCYNMFCPGFVQTSTKIALGANISPVSTYHGPQFDISLYIVKVTNENQILT